MIKLFDLEKIIYCASFVDGEGYIEWACRPKKNGLGKIHDTHVYRMEVCNTDKDIIKDMYKWFGEQGTLFEVKPKTKKHLPQLRWIIGYNKFYRLLRLISPYMRQKEKLKKIKEIVKWKENLHTTTK
tara:strand:- start:53 stop:433 length:381 start_codon:yes stop_codon:yes gene_type:complete